MGNEEEVLVFLFPTAQYLDKCVRGQYSNFEMIEGT